MGDFFSDMGKAIEKQWNRSTKEIGDAFKADLDRAVQKTEKEGFLQGALELADTFTPGNVVGELLDGFNIIPEDPGLKEMISGGVNFAAGAIIPGAGLPLQLMALKDGFDAVAACTTPPNPQAVQEAQRQGPQHCESPKERLKRAKEDAKREAIESAKCDARKKAAINNAKVEARAKAKQKSGYADGGSCMDGLNQSIEELMKRCKELFGSDKTDRADDEISKLLKNAKGMCFEDFIFALLRAVLKEGQKEVKDLGEQLADTRDTNKGTREAFDKKVADLRGKIAAEDNPERRARLETQLANLMDKRGSSVEERMESRAELAEQLKNAMQKLSEMQQAMSNILNTQHEAAMAAIRNIR